MLVRYEQARLLGARNEVELHFKGVGIVAGSVFPLLHRIRSCIDEDRVASERRYGLHVSGRCDDDCQPYHPANLVGFEIFGILRRDPRYQFTRRWIFGADTRRQNCGGYSERDYQQCTSTAAQ